MFCASHWKHLESDIKTLPHTHMYTHGSYWWGWTTTSIPNIVTVMQKAACTKLLCTQFSAGACGILVPLYYFKQVKHISCNTIICL